MSLNVTAHPADSPRFWRDPNLPFIEARTIADGRKVTYTRHAHEHFSIGAITTGRSYYHYGAQTFEICAGTVVLMNPAMCTRATRSTTSPGRITCSTSTRPG